MSTADIIALDRHAQCDAQPLSGSRISDHTDVQP